MNVLYCGETWDLEKCEIESEKWGRWKGKGKGKERPFIY